jgi:hypothetical protein
MTNNDRLPRAGVTNRRNLFQYAAAAVTSAIGAGLSATNANAQPSTPPGDTSNLDQGRQTMNAIGPFYGYNRPGPRPPKRISRTGGAKV